MNSNKTHQAIQFPEILLTRELLSTVLRWAENPGIKGGIVALPSERQLIVTQECGAPIAELCNDKYLKEQQSIQT